MHAGSVALVLNPQIGHVSPQFHVVFDDNFITAPHMRDGTILPTWDKMYKNSTKLATDKAFDVAALWFKKLTEVLDDPITDPFTTGLVSNYTENQPNITSAYKEIIWFASNSMPRLHSETLKNAMSFEDAHQTRTNAITLAPSSKFIEGDENSMPKLVNLHERGLQRSEQLKKPEEKKREEAHP